MHFEISAADQLDFKIKTLEHKIEQLQLQSNETLIANTHSGQIKGVLRRTVYDDVYFSFERIPYAQPPLGELRFRAPKPVVAWKNVRDCTHYGPKPVQLSFLDRSVEGAEDCLYLNVYTNNMKPNKPRPVMVWIYGGSFAFGEATRELYAPDYFMKKDVVLVTLQYRLGALGFLSLNDPRLHTPGNAGLKDQIMALKWVKRNAANFGGNPNCVTVFGESAGGASTMLLALSDQAKGLFHRAISQSGVATCDWAVGQCTRRAFALAQAVGYTGVNNEYEILEFLLSCSAAQISRAEADCLTPEDMKNKESFAFGPVVEPYFAQHAVLVKPPVELLSSAWGNSIPLLIGGTSKEGLMMYPYAKLFPENIKASLKTCSSFVPKAVMADRERQHLKEKGLQLRRVHVAGDVGSADEFFDLVSFSSFWHPIQKTINARLEHARKAPTYLYRFDFDSDELSHVGRLMRWGSGVRGVAHADELPYLFYNVPSKRMPQNSREYRTIERMIGLWTAFAETGNPNSAKVPGMKGIKWHPLRKENPNWKCLNISDNLEYKELPELAKLRGWMKLYTNPNNSISDTGSKDVKAYAKSSL